MKFLVVLFVPPVLQIAVAGVFAPLIVETMTDLMTDDRADSAVVDRIVGMHVEKRRLQNRSGEHHLVRWRVVISIHGLRRHMPFGTIDRRAQTLRAAIVIDQRRAPDIADEIIAFYFKRRPVAPL